MPKPARPTVVIADFEGIQTNVDPRDIPPGATEEQVNCAATVMGELTVRRGLKVVSFEE